MMPATIASNKHLLPVYMDREAIPMIHFPIWTLTRAGIQNILIITSRLHAGQIIEHINDGHNFQADVSYKIQDIDRVELGIASALKIAEDYAGDDDFAVVLGDNYHEDDITTAVENFREADAMAHVFLKEVEDPKRFGVMEWLPKESVESPCVSTLTGKRWETSKVPKYIHEKPETPPSKDAVTGLYLFRPVAFTIAEQLTLSDRGELEIVDILNHAIETEWLDWTHLDGFWSDMGTPESLRRTVLNNDFTPLNVVDWQQAIKKTYGETECEECKNIGKDCVFCNDKGTIPQCEVIEYYDLWLRDSAHRQHPVPAVIRSGRHIRNTQRKVNFSKLNVFRRDRNTCQYCCKQSPNSELTLDHVVPRSMWKGPSTPTCWTNIVTCCLPCNRKKENRTPEQAQMPLRKEVGGRMVTYKRPKPANKMELILGLRQGKCPDEWLPYVQHLLTDNKLVIPT
jgi:glucose-1-phosphate thymidylyltransferase